MTAPPQPSWWYKTKTMAHSLWIMAYPSATDEYVEEVHEALMVTSLIWLADPVIAAHPETRAFATRLVENEHTFFTNPDSQDRLKQAFELGKEMRQVVVRVIDGELDYDAGYQKGGRKDTKGQGRDGVSVVGQEEMFKDKGDKLKLIDSDAESSVGSVVAGEEKDDDLEGEGAKGHQVEYGIGWRQLDRFIRGVYDIPDDLSYTSPTATSYKSILQPLHLLTNATRLTALPVSDMPSNPTSLVRHVQSAEMAVGRLLVTLDVVLEAAGRGDLLGEVLFGERAVGAGGSRTRHETSVDGEAGKEPQSQTARSHAYQAAHARLRADLEFFTRLSYAEWETSAKDLNPQERKLSFREFRVHRAKFWLDEFRAWRKGRKGVAF